MTSVALGAYTYAEFFGCAVLILPAMGVARLLHRNDPTLRIPGRWMRRFGRLTSGLTPVWRFSVDGEPPDDILRRGYVVIANHESTADPFLLSWLPWDMRWVAKEELFRLPLLGWLMRLGGDIPIRRGERDSVSRMMDECKRTIANGLPIMMFPEGTRSPDGTLLPFKDGAFELAIACQVPILPVALAGTKQCRPKGSLWFGHARAHARVLAPIDTTGLAAADMPALKQAARDAISQALPSVRSLVADPALPLLTQDA
jgi:1-acyl-sn-glycerol-3-phosphate acyltransferase